MRTRIMTAACAAALFAALWAGVAQAEETVYLQSGEQYQCTLLGTTVDGTLKALEKGQEREFPLSLVQRIEFQKVRLYDEHDTVEALAAADSVFAEGLAPSTDDLRERYPQAGYVVLKDDAVITVEADGRWSIDRTMAWRILEQRAADSSLRAVYFLRDLEEAEVLYGITVDAEGAVARIADATMKTEAVYPAYPEYNHQQRTRFSLKNAQPGATLFLRTVRSGTASELRPLVWDAAFWGTEPALERTVRLVADAVTRARMSIATGGGLEGDAEGTAWRAESTPQIMPEPMMPPTRNFAPRLLIAYPAATWAKLARAYAERVEAAPLAVEGVTGAVEAYDRVRRDVRTVSVPFEAVPGAPAAPAATLRRRYGTAVEKAFLLEAMLKALGHEASVVLVSGRSGGEMMSSAPRLHGFDAAVVRLAGMDGSEAWLQPDAVRRAFGELDGDVQGATGLDLGTGHILVVPVRDTEDEGVTRNVQLDLDGEGNALVRDEMRWRGTQALSVRKLGDLTEEELRTWAQGFVGSQLPGVELVEFAHSEFDAANREERMAFTYKVPKLAQQAGEFLVVRLPNAQYSPSQVGRSTRQYDLFWSGRERESLTFAIRAPAGYAAYAVGEGAELEGAGWSLVSRFATAAAEPGTVNFSESWSRSTLEAPADEYGAYREALITRGVLRGEMIVFENTAQ